MFLGTPLQESLKVQHKPFGEGGLPWQVPKPNLGVMIFNECSVFVKEFDNCVVFFQEVVPRF